MPPSLMAAIFKFVRKPEISERLAGNLVVSTECLCRTGYSPVKSTKFGLIFAFRYPFIRGLNSSEKEAADRAANSNPSSGKIADAVHRATQDSDWA